MSAEKIIRTVKVNSESGVNGAKCMMERISPQPRTVTRASQSEKLLRVEKCIPSLRYLQQNSATYILQDVAVHGNYWNVMEGSEW